MNDGEGSLKRFAEDPQLYNNLNRSATSLSLLLRNLEPILADVRVFSDKVARHPELLGVGGAISGSSGLRTRGTRSNRLLMRRRHLLGASSSASFKRKQNSFKNEEVQVDPFRIPLATSARTCSSDQSGSIVECRRP